MRFNLLACLFILTTSTFAQQIETISFTETSYDFGKVNESDGPIIHEFSFKNNGLEPVQILGVKASCGCTTPSWSKEPINPGEEGHVQAQYNPSNRPGSFNKSLTVTTNLSEPLRLYIKGEVIPKVKSITDELSTQFGALRMKYSSLNLGKVHLNMDSVSQKFRVYNQSDSPLIFLDNYEAPAYIRISFEPKTLAPKAEGDIVITYNPKLKNDLGFMNDNVTFHTNESGENGRKDISIFATIEENFRHLTKEELENSPRLSIENPMFDFGRVKQGVIASTEFIIINNGARDLEIRKISSNCSCVDGTMKSLKIKPGESAILAISFNPEGRKGNQQKSVTLYSNDPRGSAQRVTIKAYLED